MIYWVEIGEDQSVRRRRGFATSVAAERYARETVLRNRALRCRITHGNEGTIAMVLADSEDKVWTDLSPAGALLL